MPEIKYNDPRALDAPAFTSEELSAARAYINFQRKQFRLNIALAEDVTFHATTTVRGDNGPDDGTPE